MAIVCSLLVLNNLSPWQERLLSTAFLQPPWQDLHPDRLAIEADLPSDSLRLARAIDSLVDRLSRERLVASFRGKGDTAHRPDLMLKVVLFLTQRGIHSPAAWAFQAKENRVVQWLLRGVCPSRARWYAFRRRLLPLIDDLNRQLLQLARRHDLLDVEVPVLDGSLLAANSTRHKLLNQATLLRRLLQLASAIAADQVARPASDDTTGRPDTAPAMPALVPVVEPVTPPPSQPDPSVAAAAAEAAASVLRQDPPAEPVASPGTLAQTASAQAASAEAGAVEAAQAEALPSPARAAGSAQTGRPWPAWMASTAQGRERQHEHYQRVQEQLHRRLEQNAKRRQEDRKPAEKVLISPGDPEACLGLDKEKVYRPLYNAQVACDLDTDFILAYGAFNRVGDAATLLPMVERLNYFLPEVELRWLLCDAGYVSGANLRQLEQEEEMALLAPYQENDWTRDKKEQKQIPKSAFKWDEPRQEYICPEGHELVYVRTQTKRRGEKEEKHRVYGCAAEYCRGCPRQQECTSSVQGRTVMRNEYEAEVQRLKERMGTAEAKALYRKRKEQIERRFADGKQHRGLRRLSMRGLEGARLQLGLTSLASNLVVFDKLSRAARDVNPSNSATSK